MRLNINTNLRHNIFNSTHSPTNSRHLRRCEQFLCLLPSSIIIASILVANIRSNIIWKMKLRTVFCITILLRQLTMLSTCRPILNCRHFSTFSFTFDYRFRLLLRTKLQEKVRIRRREPKRKRKKENANNCEI